MQKLLDDKVLSENNEKENIQSCFFQQVVNLCVPHNFFLRLLLYFCIMYIQGGPFLLKSRPGRYKYGFEALIFRLILDLSYVS